MEELRRRVMGSSAERIPVITVEDFDYTGDVQSIQLLPGVYKLECWGAQGGSYNTTYYGGKGGYSVGELTLEETTTLYVMVGGQGTGGTSSGAKAGGFNGGGKGYSTSTTYVECGGGGASDIRIGQDSLYARVIVAGGGGGSGSYSASYRYVGGAGGGTSGLTPSQYSTSYRAGTGGTQTARGNSYYGSTVNSTSYGTLAAFGVGAGALANSTSYQITGGGGGWYGGGYSRRGAGGGGSGYVYNSSSKSNYPSGCLLNSAYYLANAETKAGNTSFPSTSDSTETGHAGNGHVRITNIQMYDVLLKIKNGQGAAVSGLSVTVDSPSGITSVTTDSSGEATFSTRRGRCSISCTEYLFDISDFTVSKDMTVNVVASKGDLTGAVVTAANQTYDGYSQTPSPTVTLNNNVVSSTFYDVSYSDNINAGTATVTVTGKGAYEGTATGTFTINKANPSYTAPEARNLEYTGSSQYLTTTGSTSDGTIQYSEDGYSWSTTRVSKTAIGTYTTYWRLIGDSNHNDVSSTSITTTIDKMSRTLSFADTYAVIEPGGTVTKTATVSAGGGTITYSISSTTYATINSSTGKVTAKTSEGSAIVTATISEDSDYQSASATYKLYVLTSVRDFGYIGTPDGRVYPPGTYKLQCWGAQGGSSAADSTYGITSQSGGKGGYSEGILTLSQETIIMSYVGGQPTSTSGGYNGGGSTAGSTSYNSGNEFGTSRMGAGGGATDFRLEGGSLYSRMIVAGGGSGGAMCYREVTTTTTNTISKSTFNMQNNMAQAADNVWVVIGNTYWCYLIDISSYKGWNLQFSVSQDAYWGFFKADPAVGSAVSWAGSQTGVYTASYYNGAVPSDAKWLYLYSGQDKLRVLSDLTLTQYVQTGSWAQNSGFAGGGTTGDGGYDVYKGKQNAAGYSGSFGTGGSTNYSTVRYSSGGGGGGWYGGGAGISDSDIVSNCSGGGSGFVNTSASASYRPSGYTGLQLDSGSTTIGTSSFPAPGGGNETGHAGNGYARITRL